MADPLFLLDKLKVYVFIQSRNRYENTLGVVVFKNNFEFYTVINCTEGILMLNTIVISGGVAASFV